MIDHMIGLLLAVALLPEADPGAVVRTVSVSITDAKGAAVTGLVADEVAVLENGVVRDLVRIEPDRRPLTIALLLDTSEAVGSGFRLSILEAVTSFLNHLPAGARYALWGTGDRPTKLVDYTDDPAAAAKALKRVYPQGGATLLDALVEASKDLKTREGERTAVVVVTTMGPEFSGRERHQVVEEAGKSGAIFASVQFEEGPVLPADRQTYDLVLSELTRKTGGLDETTLSSMGVGAALRKIGADLAGQYRLSYATLPVIKEAKLEVRVARPGSKVRVGVASTAQP
jgi:VWFA-related protein